MAPTPPTTPNPTAEVELVALEDFLDPLGGAPLPDPGMWVISDDDSAEWAMRRLATLEARLAEAKDEAKQWKARIDEWFATVTNQLSPGIEFFTDRLTRYLRELRAADGRSEAKKLKSHPLPSGRITSREGALHVEVTDAHVFITWALKAGHTHLLNITPAIGNNIRPHIRELEGGARVAVVVDGEEPPGLRAWREPRTYAAKPAAGPPALPNGTPRR